MAKKNIIVIDSRNLDKKKTTALYKETQGKLKNENVIIDLKDVEKLCSQGFSQLDLSNFYGIAPETLTRQKEKDPRISQAIQQGKSKDLLTSTTELHKIIKMTPKYWNISSKLKAIEFNLSRKHGYKENAPPETPPLNTDELKNYLNDLLFVSN